MGKLKPESGLALEFLRAFVEEFNTVWVTMDGGDLVAVHEAPHGWDSLRVSRLGLIYIKSWHEDEIDGDEWRVDPSRGIIQYVGEAEEDKDPPGWVPVESLGAFQSKEIRLKEALLRLIDWGEPATELALLILATIPGGEKVREKLEKVYGCQLPTVEWFSWETIEDLLVLLKSSTDVEKVVTALYKERGENKAK